MLNELIRDTTVVLTSAGGENVNPTSGFPEGGMMGPLCYPLLPNMLVKLLEKANAGVGTSTPPAAKHVMANLNPCSASDAAKFAEGENLAQLRILILLHADDQAMPECSIPRLQAAVSIAEEWSGCTHQEYHLGATKSVVIVFRSSQDLEMYRSHGIHLNGHALSGSAEHKWLGVIWDSHLTFAPFLQTRMKAAWGAFAPIKGSGSSHAVMLQLAFRAIQSNVLGCLLGGGSTLIMAPDVVAMLDDLQGKMLRSIRNLSNWLPVAVARTDYISHLSWGEKLVLRALCFRAELWTLPGDLPVR